jgi:thioredoxin
MSNLINITSKEAFSSLLSSSTIVVTDFYADWCGPCKAIGPLYEQLANQLSRPSRITFCKVNVDEQKEVAQAYGVSAMPTFMIFKNGRVVSTIQGADRRKLSEAVQKLASEASAIEGAATGEGFGESSGGPSWVGAAVPKGYSDITDQVHVKGLDLLNCDSERGPAKVLFSPSKPSALATNGGNKGKDKAEETPDWVQSDTDEQLMLYIPFTSTLKVHSLHITSISPRSDSDDDDDEIPMRPRTMRLYINRPHVLGFDEAEDIDPVQTVAIEPRDWDDKTGTAKIELRFVKFQKVTSLVIFFVDGDGDSEKILVDRLRIFGESGGKLEMGKLEKIGDEPGE